MSRTFEGAEGNRLVASEIGTAERCILLLHGGGQTRHAWSRTARRLAEAGWRAIAVDQRGHGDSAWSEHGAYAAADSIAACAISTRSGTARRGRSSRKPSRPT